MQPHLKRAFTILALIIIAFIFVRSLVVPESFGQYGWYRGDSVRELRNLGANYTGSTSCGEANCHENIYTVWSKDRHKTVNCETCHDPAQKHVLNAREPLRKADDSRDFCGKCHFKRISRPETFPQIDSETHGEDLRCVYCHNPHKPWFD